jgi:dihydrofolate reductase
VIAGLQLDAVNWVLVITYSMSLSADGYIAGPDGSFDWAKPSRELHRFHNERVGAVDAQLLGRRLYETMLVWDTEEFSDPTMAEFAEIWRPLEKIVFSSTLTAVEGTNRLATGLLEEEIAALGDRRIAVGGAGLAAACMRRGLVDEFEMFVVPVVVGGGTPYFPPDVHVDLERVETRDFDGTVYLHYRRRG